MEKLVWRTEKRKVKDLKLFEGNPRKMSKEQAQQLLKSLKKFNLVEIPAINTDNTVLAGNQRIQALITLGREDEEIDVRVPNRKLTEQEAKEYLLRSNKNVGDWDWDLLESFDEELLKDVGFNIETSVPELPVVDVEIRGETEETKEFLVIEFDTKEEYEAVKKALGMSKTQRVVGFAKFKEVVCSIT